MKSQLAKVLLVQSDMGRMDDDLKTQTSVWHADISSLQHEVTHLFQDGSSLERQAQQTDAIEEALSFQRNLIQKQKDANAAEKSRLDYQEAKLLAEEKNLKEQIEKLKSMLSLEQTEAEENMSKHRGEHRDATTGAANLRLTIADQEDQLQQAKSQSERESNAEYAELEALKLHIEGLITTITRLENHLLPKDQIQSELSNLQTELEEETAALKDTREQVDMLHQQCQVQLKTITDFIDKEQKKAEKRHEEMERVCSAVLKNRNKLQESHDKDCEGFIFAPAPASAPLGAPGPNLRAPGPMGWSPAPAPLPGPQEDQQLASVPGPAPAPGPPPLSQEAAAEAAKIAAAKAAGAAPAPGGLPTEGGFPTENLPSEGRIPTEGALPGVPAPAPDVAAADFPMGNWGETPNEQLQEKQMQAKRFPFGEEVVYDSIGNPVLKSQAATIASKGATATIGVAGVKSVVPAWFSPNSVGSDGSYVYPDGTVRSPDGTLLSPTGQPILRKDGQPIKIPFPGPLWAQPGSPYYALAPAPGLAPGFVPAPDSGFAPAPGFAGDANVAPGPGPAPAPAPAPAPGPGGAPGIQAPPGLDVVTTTLPSALPYSVTLPPGVTLPPNASSSSTMPYNVTKSQAPRASEKHSVAYLVGAALMLSVCPHLA
mmetsp:Transcript_41000/g.88436  ORF Transcript_41000/g.88436 Transcript_41000/m.88436 type:complete len:654 (-) Transcript_41000:18-1979(-)